MVIIVEVWSGEGMSTTVWVKLNLKERTWPGLKILYPIKYFKLIFNWHLTHSGDAAIKKQRRQKAERYEDSLRALWEYIKDTR